MWTHKTKHEQMSAQDVSQDDQVRGTWNMVSFTAELIDNQHETGLEVSEYFAMNQR